jgi:hypothetical protein
VYFFFRQLKDELHRGVLPSQGALFALDYRRLRALLVIFLLFLYGQPVTRFFWMLDKVFFPGYRKQTILEPTFIVGNFRSGTSLVQRLLARDRATFTTLSTFDIYVAPTISQRKLARALGGVDRLLGAPVTRLIRRIDARFLQTIPHHPIHLFGPEEDVGLLLYPWACFFTWFVFPQRDAPPRLSAFDHEVPAHARRRIMHFYADALRRHLYDLRSRGKIPHGSRVRILSKNPSFTPMIGSLSEYFPDSKFIYLYRDPEATLASTMRWFSIWFGLLGTNPGPGAYLESMMKMLERWYRRPLSVLPHLPEERWQVIRYGDFVLDKEDTVRKLYHRLDLSPVGPAGVNLGRAVREEDGAHRSRPAHDPEVFGASRQEIDARYAHLIQQLDRLRYSKRNSRTERNYGVYRIS